MDDPDPDLLVGQLLQRSLDRLGGALDVRLDDDIQVLHLAGLDLAEQVLQRDLAHIVVQRALLLMLALLHQLTGHALVGHSMEVIARAGHLAHADDLHGDGGAGISDLLALVVGHGADAAHGSAGDDHITLVQGAVLDQQGGNRTAALVQAGLDDRAVGRAVGVGPQLTHLGGEDYHVQQVVDPHARLGGDGADDGLAAPLLRHQLVLGELLHDPVGVGGGLIHLIDGDNDGNLGGLGVVDGFHGLGHDAVVGGHHQDGYVGDHGAAGAHSSEGLVAGGVQEGDRAALDVHLIGADVLGDAARLAGDHVGVADIVQQGGLTVVDVAHDHHHGGAGLKVLLLVLGGVDQLLLDGDHDFLLHLAAQLHGYQGGSVVVDDLTEGGHHAHLHQGLDHLGAGLFHAGGQLAHADLVGDHHLQRSLLGDLQLEAAHLLGLLLLALVAGALLAAALALGVAALELLLAAALLLPLGGEALQTLVVLIQVHRTAAAGVHHLLGGDAGCGLALDGLLLGLAASAALLLDRSLLAALGGGGLLAMGGLLGGSALLVGGWGLLGLLCGGLGRLMVHILIDGGDGLHLVVLGEILKNNGKLLFGQGLHMVLGGMSVLGKDVHDLLGGELLGAVLEILCDLVDGIFDHHIRKPPHFLGIVPELAGQPAAARAGLMGTAGAGGGAGAVPAAGGGGMGSGAAAGLARGLLALLSGPAVLLGRHVPLGRGRNPGGLLALPEVFLVLPLLPLPLKDPVGLLPELLGGGAVALRSAGGQLLGEGGGKAGVRQGQHGAGTPAQGEAQLCLGEGDLQPQDISGLAEVGGPAAGVGGGVAGQKDQACLPGAADRAHRLLADLQTAGLAGQTKQMENGIIGHLGVPPSSEPPVRPRPRLAAGRRRRVPGPGSSWPWPGRQGRGTGMPPVRAACP